MNTIKIHWDELDSSQELHSELTGKGRWELYSTVVVEHKDYGPVMFRFTQGGTENQDMDSADMYNADSDGMVIVTPVELRDVTVMRWMPRRSNAADVLITIQSPSSEGQNDKSDKRCDSTRKTPMP